MYFVTASHFAAIKAASWLYTASVDAPECTNRCGICIGAVIGSRGGQDGADFNMRILAATESLEERIASLAVVERAPVRVKCSTAVMSSV